MIYIKKLVEIEAVLWDGKNFREIPDWLQAALDQEPRLINDGSVFILGDSVYIHTLEGVITASPGDYIIKGIKGELYPCKPDIFEMTYDKV